MSTLILKSNTDTNFFSSSSNSKSTSESNDESSSLMLATPSLSSSSSSLSSPPMDPSTLSLAPLTQMMSFAALAPSTSEFANVLAKGTLESSALNNFGQPVVNIPAAATASIELCRTPGENNSYVPTVVDDFRPGSSQLLLPIVLSSSTKVPDPPTITPFEASLLLQLKSSQSRTVTADGFIFREVFDPDQDEGCKQALQLYSQSFFEPTEPSVNHISNLASSHFYRILIMEDENQQVLACAFIIEIHQYKCYHLDYFCVKPGSRGGGIGGKFFKQLSTYLRDEQKYLMMTLESETSMVGWYLKQSCLHLNVNSDQFTDETGDTRYWWLLIVPLGKVIDDNSDSDTDSEEPPSTLAPSLPPASLSLKKRSKSYILHNGSIFYEFNQQTLKTIVTAVKSLLLLVSGK